MDDDRSGVLLIRVWVEQAGEFRARMTTPGQGAGGDDTVAFASSPEEVSAALRQWLRDFLSSGVWD